MILSIELDGEKVPLIAQRMLDNANLKLFHADAMTLVVGPNGAGKTRLLNRLIEGVLEGDAVAIDSTRPLPRVKMIYLTLSHFGASPCSGTQRNQLYAITRKDGQADPENLQRICDWFGRNAGVQVRLLARNQEGLQWAVRAARAAWKSGRFRAAGLISALEAESEIKRRLDRHRGDVEEASDLMRQLPAIQLHIQREIRQLIVDRDPLWLRAVHALSKLKPPNDHFLAWLASEIGIGPRIRRDHNARHLSDAMETYVRRLSRLARLVGDRGLDRDLYALSPERRSRLSPTDLGELARLDLGGVSSGIAALATQLAGLERAVARFKVTSRARDSTLVIMIDEGDVYLHLAWQQRYVTFLNQFVEQIKAHFAEVQVIVTTHSPILMSDFPRDCIVRLDPPDGAGQAVTSRDHEIVSFGAPLAEIVKHTGEAGAMGEFARSTLQRWIRHAAEGGSIHPDCVELIDDPVIRRMLFAAMKATPQSRSSA